VQGMRPWLQIPVLKKKIKGEELMKFSQNSVNQCTIQNKCILIPINKL
jgi:hypothetical protein